MADIYQIQNGVPKKLNPDSILELGEAGQVLTRNEDGSISWQDLPESGITEEQVQDKIDQAIQALPEDSITSEEQVNNLIDTKLETYEPLPQEGNPGSFLVKTEDGYTWQEFGSTVTELLQVAELKVLVPEGTSYQYHTDNHIISSQLPKTLSSNATYILDSPFGNDPCIAQPLIYADGKWCKSDIIYTGYLYGTSANCPGDGKVYVNTGALLNDYGSKQTPSTVPTPNSAGTEVVILLYHIKEESKEDLTILVPEGTTYPYCIDRQLVVSGFPKTISTNSSYILNSPYGNDPCLTLELVYADNKWVKTDTIYTSYYYGTISSCPGDGKVYLNTGAYINNYTSTPIPDSTPTPNAHGTEAVIILFHPKKKENKFENLTVVVPQGTHYPYAIENQVVVPELPLALSKSTGYVIPSPLGNKPCLCIPLIYADGKWVKTNVVYSSGYYSTTSNCPGDGNIYLNTGYYINNTWSEISPSVVPHTNSEGTEVVILLFDELMGEVTTSVGGLQEDKINELIDKKLEEFNSGLTEEQVQDKIDQAIQALPSDEVSTEAKVNELIDNKLSSFESGTDEETVNSLIDNKLSSLEHPVQAAHFDELPISVEGLQEGMIFTVGDGKIEGLIGGTGSNINALLGDVIGIKRLGLGGGSGTWSTINQDRLLLSASKSYFDNHPVWGGIQEEMIDGQYMVRIPKFYLKNNEHREIWISPTMKEGFHCHPAFMHQGQEIPCFWIGKYMGYNQDGKMCSIPDVYPTVSVSRTTCESLCSARNTGGIEGFMLESVYQWQAINFLMLVEMQTTDMQSVIGRGHIDGSSSLKVDNPMVAQATYRGIVGLWGNVWQWIQGLETSGGYYKIWDNKGNQELQTTDVTQRTAGSWSYITSVDVNSSNNYDFGDVFLPNASQNNEGTYANGTYSDGIYGGSGGACSVGGYWSVGSYAGPFCLALNPDASATYPVIGCRLCKI